MSLRRSVSGSWICALKKDKQATYEEGKESTFVRITLRFLPKEYDAAVKEVRSLVRFRKDGEAGTISTISNLEDISRMNYSEDLWLLQSTRMRAGIAMTAQKGAVRKVLLWP